MSNQNNWGFFKYLSSKLNWFKKTPLPQIIDLGNGIISVPNDILPQVTDLGNGFISVPNDIPIIHPFEETYAIKHKNIMKDKNVIEFKKNTKKPTSHEGIKSYETLRYPYSYTIEEFNKFIEDTEENLFFNYKKLAGAYLRKSEKCINYLEPEKTKKDVEKAIHYYEKAIEINPFKSFDETFETNHTWDKNNHITITRTSMVEEEFKEAKHELKRINRIISWSKEKNKS